MRRRSLFKARAMNRSKQAGPTDEKPHRGRARGRSRIRETEAARTLLQEQLYTLYWWVFNASRIKGFLRAKELDVAQSVANASVDEAGEQIDANAARLAAPSHADEG